MDKQIKKLKQGAQKEVKGLEKLEVADKKRDPDCKKGAAMKKK